MRKFNITFWLILLAFYWSAGWALDDEHKLLLALVSEQDPAGQAYQKAYNNILDEKWQEALTDLEKVLNDYPDSRWVDDARFWQCYAREKLNHDLEEVFECYSQFIKSYAESDWVAEAKTNLIRIGRQLIQNGKQEYQAIIKSMEEGENEEIVLQALSALQHMGDERAVTALIDIYDTNSSSLIKDKIIFTLSNFDDSKSKEKLIEIAQEENNVELRKKAVFWLGNRASSQKEIKILEAIVINDPEYSVKEKAIFAISQASNDLALSSLTHIATKHPDPKLREKAVFWLGQEAKSRETIRVLETIVDTDRDRSVREKAVFAISQAPEEIAIPTLVKIVKTNSDRGIREKAVFWLGQAKSSNETIVVLKDIVEKDPDQGLREKAIFAISQASKEFGIPALTDLARNHPDIAIREKAIFWLGQEAESKQVINILLNIIETDPEAQIREFAVNAISQAPDAAGIPALIQLAQRHSKKEIRLKAIFWLGHNAESTEIIDVLLAVANNDPDSDVQDKAIFALSQAEELGIPALIDIAKNHSKTRLRKKAIFWLGNSDDPRAREALLQIINQPN